MRFLWGVLVGGVLLLSGGAVHAAAWTLEASKGQFIQNNYYYSTQSYFDSQGNEQSQGKYVKYDLNPYVEYGLTDEVTLGLSTSFQNVRQEDGNTLRSNVNLADTEFFVRYKLWSDESQVVSIQPLVKIPGLYDKEDQPALGQSQIDAEMRLLYGKSFKWLENYHYTNVELAYRKRLEDPSDELRLDATLGLRPHKKWTILNQWFHTRSLGSPSTNGPQFANSSDYTLNKLQISVAYEFSPKYTFQCGMFKHMSGENTGAGNGLLFSVWQRF